MKKLTVNEHEYLTEHIMKLLFQNHIISVLDFLQEDAEKLSIVTKLKFSEVIEIRNHLFNKYSSSVLTGTELLSKSILIRKHLRTGIEKLDAILCGGLPIGYIAELCGLACSGKSQMCMQMAINCVKNIQETVLYIDTKGDFSAVRIQKILDSNGVSYKDMANIMLKIKVINIWTLNDLLKFMNKLKDKTIALENLSLIIIDSLPSLMFQHFGEDNKIGLNLLNRLVSCCRSISRELQLSVICVNIETRWVDQDVEDMDEDDGIEEITKEVVYKERRIRCLGRYWQHIPYLVIHLEKQQGDNDDSKSYLVNVTVTKFNVPQNIIGKCVLNLNMKGYS